MTAGNLTNLWKDGSPGFVLVLSLNPEKTSLLRWCNAMTSKGPGGLCSHLYCYTLGEWNVCRSPEISVGRRGRTVHLVVVSVLSLIGEMVCLEKVKKTRKLHIAHLNRNWLLSSRSPVGSNCSSCHGNRNNLCRGQWMIRYGFLSLNTGFASCSSLKAYSQVYPEDGGKCHQVEQRSFQDLMFPKCKSGLLIDLWNCFASHTSHTSLG